MAWAKPTERMVELFDSLLPQHAAVERRKMFGCPVGFVNGNMFIGLHENRMILRLGEKERESFIAEFGAGIFEPMPGRPMREYVVVPEALLGDRPTLHRWCERSLDYAGSLPAKKPKQARARKNARPRRERTV